MKLHDDTVEAARDEKITLTVEIDTRGPGTFRGFATNMLAAFHHWGFDAYDVRVIDAKPYVAPVEVLPFCDLIVEEEGDPHVSHDPHVSLLHTYDPAITKSAEGVVKITNNDGASVTLDVDKLREFLR